MYIFGISVPLTEFLAILITIQLIIITLQLIIVFKENKNLKMIEEIKTNNKPQVI